jgi:uncharacterized protein (TIGR00251 family)
MPKHKKQANSGNPNSVHNHQCSNIDPIQFGSPESDSATMRIVVKPNSPASQIYFDGEFLHIDVTAPPDKSKANTEVIKTVARQLAIPNSQVEIISGHTSRDKILRIHGAKKALEKFQRDFHIH